MDCLSGPPARRLRLCVSSLPIHLRLLLTPLCFARPEVVTQTSGFPRNKVEGYCAADGGLEKAQDVYNAYLRSLQSVCAVSAENDLETDTESSATIDGEECYSSDDEEGYNWSKDLHPTKIEGASDDEISELCAVDKEIKEDENENEGDLQHPSLPPPVDSQEPLIVYTSGICLKREELDSRTSGMKRRAFQRIEATSNSKNLRCNHPHGSEKRARSAETRNSRPISAHPRHSTIERHRELQEVISKCSDNAHGEFKTESITSHVGPIQHPWLGRFQFTRRHNHESLMTAISSAFTFVTSQCDPPLCQEQLDLIYTVLSGQNLFYTGSAGCGKSTVLNVIVQILMTLGVLYRSAYWLCSSCSTR